MAKLIDDIYVQERTDKTDEQCKEAKGSLGRINRCPKELVEGERTQILIISEEIQVTLRKMIR